MKTLLVLGGGFAGLWAALAAARVNDEQGGGIAISLISPSPYLTLRPRLYQAAPETLRTPLRNSLEPVNVAFVQGAASAIDPEGRTISLASDDGPARMLGFDRLILATGSAIQAPAVPGAAFFRSIDDFDSAVAFETHLGTLYAQAPSAARDTFVIIGAGITGIELATELRDRIAGIAGDAAAGRARIILIEHGPVVGPVLDDTSRTVIAAAIADAGIDVRTGTTVRAATEDTVVLDTGDMIATQTAIIATGLRASPLAASIGTALDDAGRLPVDSYLRVEGTPAIYAAGDVARALADSDHAAPMSCQHAMPMGRYAGYNAARGLYGLDGVPYTQPKYVTCVDLGRSGALRTAGWDRTFAARGKEAKTVKRMINTELIYPPQGKKASILAAAAPPEVLAQ